MFTETIKLDDQVSAPAKAAGKEVLSFVEKMAAGKVAAAAKRAALAALVPVLGETLPAAGKKSVKVFENLTDAMFKAQNADAKLAAQTLAGKNAAKDAAAAIKTAEKAKATALAESIEKQTKMANTMATVRDAVSSSVAGMKSAFTSLAAGDVKGAIAGVTDSLAGMSKMLDLLVPGLGQVVSTIIQIAGGLVGLTAGLVKGGIEFAIASSEAKQQMLGLFTAMGGGIVTGEATEAMIDSLKDKFGIAKDSLIGYTNELHRLGMTDLSKIEQALHATASAAALVKGGDAAFLSLTKKIQTFVQTGEKLKLPLKGLGSLADVGLTVADVAAKMGVSAEALGKSLAEGTVDAAKFGDAMQTALIQKGAGPLAKFAASSANIKKLLSESFGDMFEDIDVGPFLKEIKELFDIFGQSKSSGQAMKSGIGGFFKEVLSSLTKAVPMAKHFLLDLVIYGLKAYIALKPIVKTIKDFASSATGVAVIDGLVMAFKAIGVVVLGAVAVIAVLVGIIVVMSAAFGAALGMLIGFGVTIFEFLEGAAAALGGWVKGAATAAYDFIAGLISGIASGAGMVIDAVKGLASSALGAFTSALGIASPSKVMMQMGGHMTDGVAEGLDAGAADVAGASSGVAGSAVKGMSEGAEGGGQAGGKGGSNITVQVMIDGAGKSALEITEEMVSAVFGRMALQAGV